MPPWRIAQGYQSDESKFGAECRQHSEAGGGGRCPLIEL
jgi:hypothetical protein